MGVFTPSLCSDPSPAMLSWARQVVRPVPSPCARVHTVSGVVRFGENLCLTVFLRLQGCPLLLHPCSLTMFQPLSMRSPV